MTIISVPFEYSRDDGRHVSLTVDVRYAPPPAEGGSPLIAIIGIRVENNAHLDCTIADIYHDFDGNNRALELLRVVEAEYSTILGCCGTTD